MDFWGVPGEVVPKNFGKKIAFAAQQLYTKIRFRCVVGYEKKSVQKLGRKKRNKSHRGQKWVGWDERVS